MPFQIEDLLADSTLTLVTTDADEALIVDWYEWSGQPESFVEMRFGAVWERVQCDVQSVTAKVGRDLTTEAVEAGQCVIRFDNRSGRYTDWQDQVPPINESTEIRIRVRYPTITSALGEQVLWWGYVQEWEQEWTRSSDTVVVTAVDAVSLLVEQGGTLGWTAGGFNDTVLVRLAHLLSRAGHSYRRLYAEQGRGGLINPEITDRSVRDEIQATADTDGGHFFVECDGDSYYFVYLNRERFTRQPIDIQGTYITPVSTTTTLQVGAQAAGVGASDTESGLRIIGQYRLAQPFIPLFSDMCGIETPEAHPYTDLEWHYRGWEIPSIVAVSNAAPPSPVDADGKPLTPPWTQIGALASGGGRRHNVAEFTDLRFIDQSQAQSLANTYAEALSRSSINITMLQVHPELDDRLWDVVGQLRQGDWVSVERNLVTDRLTAMCSIEGIHWDLVPSMSGGEPKWKVTYRLASISVRADPIPESVRPPLPPTVNEQPPLPEVLKLMSLDPFGAGSTFVERGTTDGLFTLRITDPNHGDHLAFARNEDIGTVQLPPVASGTYSGDVITRQFGGIPMTPGTWEVWVRDRVIVNRLSNTQFAVVPEWATPAITAMEWLPETESTVSYTDDRYPEMAARVFAIGRGGVREMAVLNWRRIAARSFEIDFASSALPPGEWDIWVQDPVLNQRQSLRVTVYKPSTAPTGLRMGIFHPLDEWDAQAWSSIPVVCNPVTDATGYDFEIKDLVDPTVAVRVRGEVAPATDLSGGRVVSGQQQEKRFEVRVRSKVNAELSGWSNPIVVETGYPAFILRQAMAPLGKAIPITTRNQVAGMVVPGVFTPPGSQSSDPDAPRFVGTEVTRLRFVNLYSQIVYGDVVNIKLNYAEDGTSDLRHVIGTASAAAPGGSPAVPDGQGALVTQNPSTPWSGTMPVQYILGSQSRFIGIRLEGVWWGTSGPTQPGSGQGGWIKADAMYVEGTQWLWLPSKYPRQL